MKTILEERLKFISQSLPLNWLIQLSKRKILLPFYHTVSDNRLPHISNLYGIKNTKSFSKDIDFFCKHYNPISIDELYSITFSQKKLNRPAFHLTFDDGLNEFYTVIAPILERKGIPATVFVNTGFIDNTDLFYRYKISLAIEQINLSNKFDKLKDIFPNQGLKSFNKQEVIGLLLRLSYPDRTTIDQICEILNVDYKSYLQTSQPYLSTDEIFNLINRGFTIGSHSVDHPHFWELSIEEQKNQVNQSFSCLEKIGIKNDRYFSFPFSDDGVHSQFFHWLYKDQECKLSFGISGLKDDFTKFHLHRIPMEGTSASANELIKSEYLYYLLKSPLGKNKILRK